MNPEISLVIGGFDMARELPRTLRSLSPGMQRGLGGTPYDILVVDNGSPAPFDAASCRSLGLDLRVDRIAAADASPSPVRALNAAVRRARGDLVGVLIDGARMASPGLIAMAKMAARLAPRTVILSLGFHLGPVVQMVSCRNGYDQAAEDQLLSKSRWTEDGYRLFDIAVFAGSSQNGWFAPIAESNALFMPRDLWAELGGFDERFETPGGGFANLDLLARAVALPGVTVVTLLGEGTFHQVHGGVATNQPTDHGPVFAAEYRAIRGVDFVAPEYRSLYVGSPPSPALRSIAESAIASLEGRPACGY